MVGWLFRNLTSAESHNTVGIFQFIAAMAVLFCRCGASYYLQDATVENLPSYSSPQLTKVYVPHTLNMSLSANIPRSDLYEFNNGEHSKVNRFGLFQLDSTGQPDSDNFDYQGKNVFWNIGMPTGRLSLIYDFSRFSGIVSDMTFGGTGGRYYFDFFMAGDFRTATHDLGFRFAIGIGVKDYRYHANVFKEQFYESDDGAPSITTYTQMSLEKYRFMEYLQIGFTFNVDFQLPMGLYLQGSYRLSPDIMSTPSDTPGIFDFSTVSLNPSTLVCGFGAYFNSLPFLTPFAGIDFIIATNAVEWSSYPMYIVGVRSDFCFDKKNKE